ncbi:predicted protein [Sclerotinia sclerotiorum 1980 UF-70]|uniref:IBR domain-containing protein n=1 Tax=Sclerotinia sclerotiorum (strain ATCC 18683 / 1980 / Ss-1) TaxID=665079 RepID=A7ESA0_SCLS1|nr:predicted protein [Sclerotinia sclerotiorum 1980 UF-70]EDN92342.1 predicted protein [Sclerotinia sclerotiorum 1980 UF-70]
MGRRARVTKSPIKADEPALPQTIFALPLGEYKIPLIKHILSFFCQKSTFKRRKSLTSLLQKLAQIEQTLPKDEQGAVSQLLHHNMPITRAAIKAGPQKEDADGKLLGMSEGKNLEYKNYLRMLEICHLPNFRWCLNAACDAGQLHKHGFNDFRVICDVCKSASCFRHQVPLARAGKIMRCKACENGVKILEFAGTKLCPQCKAPTIMEPIVCEKATCCCGYKWSDFTKARAR